MNVLSNLCFFIVAVAAFLFGLFIFRNPTKTFEIQRKFYALINWDIRPISLEKEIRNTKIMGMFLMLFVFAASVYVLINKKGPQDPAGPFQSQLF